MARDELGAAIAAGDLVRALPLALDAWRAHRSIDRAELVDALSAHCVPIAPPRGGHHLHGWWMALARAPDAADVATLIRSADHIVEHAEGQPEATSELLDAMRGGASRAPLTLSQRIRVERTAAMIAWPDDPRTTAVLARWFVECPFEGSPALDAVVAVYLDAVARRLIELADPRAIPPLQTLLSEPRGRTPGIRAAQARIADVVLTALERSTATALPLERAAWIEQLGGRPRHDDTEERALWDEIARAPLDLAPRLVLADYLQRRGDLRGELIVLQCSETRHAAERARKLLIQHRDRWLGDLALVLRPQSCVFRRGMIEEAVVGRSWTPEWAYAKLRGHRELATLHTVSPSGTIPPHRYLEVIEQLGHPLASVALTWPILEELARRTPLSSVAAVRFEPTPTSNAVPPLDVQLALLAATVPAFETLRFTPAPLRPDEPEPPVCAALIAFRARMPGLRRVVVAAKLHGWDFRLSPAQRARLAELPWVELAS